MGVKKVLVADDHEGTAKIIAMYLNMKGGYETKVVYNGKDAIVEALDFLPDVLILDIRMEGLSGFEVIRKLKPLAEFKEKKFVALTMLDEQCYMDEAHQVGFDEYLTKPFDLELLLKVVGENGS